MYLKHRPFIPCAIFDCPSKIIARVFTQAAVLKRLSRWLKAVSKIHLKTGRLTSKLSLEQLIVLFVNHKATWLSLGVEAPRAWQDHADLAWKGGGLQILCTALESRALASGTEMGEIFRRPVLELMVAFLGCFSITPSGLPVPALDAVLSILSGIFQGELWSTDHFSHFHIRKVLLYPKS